MCGRPSTSTPTPFPRHPQEVRRQPAELHRRGPHDSVHVLLATQHRAGALAHHGVHRALLGASGETLFSQWAATVTGTSNLASTASQVEKSALQYLAEAPEATQLASLLTSNGFRAGRKATKRYYEKIFNGQLRYVVASATQ